MARPLRIEFEGAVYHVTARGNERKKIFFTKRDYERFKEYLTFARERFGCFLHGYVLMSNHYHLILETPEGNLSRIMHYLNGSYTTYINAKRKRRGHLFQGRFKSIVVDKDSYLLELSRYLHLNPVRAGMVEQPEDYAYSSYRSFVGKKVEPFLLTNPVLKMFSTNTSVARIKYLDFVESAVGEETLNPFSDVYGGMILGNEMFIKEILGRLEDGLINSEEISHRKVLCASVDVDLLLNRVCAHYNCLRQDLKSNRKARRITIYLLKKFTPLSNREVAALLGGIGCSGVGKAFSRVSATLQMDKTSRDEVEEIMR